MIPLVSVSIIVISFLAVDRFSKTIQFEIITEMEIISENLIDKLSRGMFERVADIKFLSTGNALSNPNFSMAEKVDYLRDMERTYKTYASMSVYAANGTKIGDTRNVLMGLNEANKPFFKHAIQGEVYYDKIPVMSQSLKQYVIHFSAPLRDTGGKINGVVTARYPMTKLHDIFREPHLELVEPQHGKVHDLRIDLVSSNGLILYSNYDRKSILSKNISEVDLFLNLKQRESETALESVDGQETMFIGLGQGKGYLDYRGSGWFLILSEPAEVIFAGLRALTDQFIIISAIILVAAVFLVFVLASRISKPIVRLKRAALQVSEGRYDIPIITTKVKKGNKNIDIITLHNHSDEFRELASTLETMRQNVQNVNSNLNAMVAKRTIQLETANEVLKVNESELENVNRNLMMADRAKEEFMSMISHELKSPLAPMKLYAELLLKSCSAALAIEPPASTSLSTIEKQIKGLKIILRNILRLERLVSDILDVYKMDIGTLRLRKSHVSLTKFVEENVKDLIPLAAEKQVQLVADIQTVSGISIWCDPHRISQVICNLVRNSIDFVPEKTGKIIVRAEIYGTDYYEAKTEKGQESIQMVLFAVEDNGTGIPPEKIDSLFKKFYQIDTSLTRRHGGTGLGLAICKGIIESHGGKIWVDKEYTEGTSVKFTLPRSTNNATTKEENK
jgi:signal transduction histidine kinase